jgi:hypothetical protein
VPPTPDIRLRLVACPESLGDGKGWSFYLVNDSDVPLDSTVLKTFGHEWGGTAHVEHPNVEVVGLAPRAHARMWRDNDDEVRMWATLAVRVGALESEWEVEYPLLYKRMDELTVVAELGLRGWSASGVGIRPPRG